MNRIQSIDHLRDCFRNFVLLAEHGYAHYFCDDHKSTIQLCSEPVVSDVDSYAKEFRNATRIDLIDDLHVCLAVERFIERLVAWMDARDHKRHGLSSVHSDKPADCQDVRFDELYGQWYVDELEHLRLAAARLLRALDKLRLSQQTYSHPVLAYSDQVHMAGKRWSKPQIAKAYYQGLDWSAQAALKQEHGSVDDAIAYLKKKLDNYRHELIHPPRSKKTS
jgi:hypothetical protein